VKRDALPFYRVMAYVTGVFLLLLCVGMFLRYGPADDPTLSSIVAPLHGWLYVIYLVATGLLVYQRQWPNGQAVLIALAGTVPFASFFAERYVVTKAREHGRVR
jgi:integral membrane protein